MPAGVAIPLAVVLAGVVGACAGLWFAMKARARLDLAHRGWVQEIDRIRATAERESQTLRRQVEVVAREDPGVVPLGLPLIAGPAMLTTLLILIDTIGILYTLLSLLVNLLLVYLAIRNSAFLARRIGTLGLRAASKIIMLLLAAIAVSMIRRGWQAM